MKIELENLSFINIDERLEHLSEVEISEITQKYFSGEKATDLVKDYKIAISPSHLYSILPPLIVDEVCSVCDAYMVKHLGSKTGYSNEKEYCDNCGHENIKTCKCSTCEIERKFIFEKKKQKICNFFNEDNWSKIEEDDLNLIEKLYLAVILRCALSENTAYIKPLVDVRGELAPYALT